MLKVFLADDEMWIILGLKKLIQKSGLPFRVIGWLQTDHSPGRDQKAAPGYPFLRHQDAWSFPALTWCAGFQRKNPGSDRSDQRLRRV